MLEFVYDVFWFLCGIAVELFLFSIVEKIVTKVYLPKARDNNEKRAIWLMEGAVLFVMCIVVYIHHMPYFLFAMACLALIYTIFLQNMNLGNYLQELLTTWQDFVDYDSLRPSASSTAQPQQGTALAAGAPPPGSQNQVNAAPSIPVHQSEPPLTFPAGGCGALPQNEFHPDAVAVPSNTPNASTASVPRKTQQLARPGSQPVRPQPSNTGMVASSMPPSSATRVDANPDRTSNTSSMSRLADFLKHVLETPTSVKTWFQTFGQDGTIPPGLVNHSQQNLCFINCILQTLSRSPQLVDNLKLVSAPGHIQHIFPTKLTFLREVVDIFHKLTVCDQATPTGQFIYHKSPLDTRSLRKELSANCDLQLVQHPWSGLPQPQQDAAEFLLWLLDALHDILNVKPAASAPSMYARPSIHNPLANQLPHSVLSNSAQVSLDKLRAAYNYPSTDWIKLYKQRCQDEVAGTNGRDQSIYVPLVTRLSDLDWLLYKEKNNSIVDDLFTGQQVSACICLGCNHISVSTDTFRILTVPIPSGHDFVTIVDCFTELIQVENLTQQNRPRFESCKCLVQNNFPGNAYHLCNNQPNFQTSTPNGPVRHRSGILPCSPGMGALSPINGVNRDHHVETPSRTTSTPLYNLQQPINTNCQRQTSLQRLPDCLVVQLLRFRFVNQNPIKVDTRVKVFVNHINLSPLIRVRQTFPEPLFYSLYGICMHSNSSSTQSGHYYAYSLSSDGQWYLFNDSTVSRVEIECELDKKEVQENVYLLYYRKVVSTVQS